MKKIKNNEGKNVQVSESMYNELRASFEQGVNFAYIKIGEQPHCILLDEIFAH